MHMVIQNMQKLLNDLQECKRVSSNRTNYLKKCS